LIFGVFLAFFGPKNAIFLPIPIKIDNFEATFWGFFSVFKNLACFYWPPKINFFSKKKSRIECVGGPGSYPQMKKNGSNFDFCPEKKIWNFQIFRFFMACSGVCFKKRPKKGQKWPFFLGFFGLINEFKPSSLKMIGSKKS
jgi:hypothetical protein